MIDNILETIPDWDRSPNTKWYMAYLILAFTITSSGLPVYFVTINIFKFDFSQGPTIVSTWLLPLRRDLFAIVSFLFNVIGIHWLYYFKLAAIGAGLLLTPSICEVALSKTSYKLPSGIRRLGRNPSWNRFLCIWAYNTPGNVRLLVSIIKLPDVSD